MKGVGGGGGRYRIGGCRIQDEGGERGQDNCWLTPSQPRRSYQGDGRGDKKEIMAMASFIFLSL